MMRIFGIFDRKKQIPGRSSAPNSRSSVHPANSNGGDLYSVKRAKIKELLGIVTPRECQEVDELLNQACWIDPISDEDADSLESGITEEIDLQIEGGVCDGGKLQANPANVTILPIGNVCVELTSHKLAQHSPRSSCKSSAIKHGEEHVTQKSSFIDKSAKADSVQGPAKTFRQARPAKLSCVSKDKVASLINRDFPSERIAAPHPIRTGGKKFASCMKSFPLPPPFEKHYLPTPRPHTAEEISFIAHPLPQPPLIARALEDKGHPSIVRAASCEPPVKPQLTAKEYDTIVKAVSCDPPRQVMQRLKALQPLSGRSFSVLQQVPPTTPFMILQSQGYQTPQNTPPTTPRQQGHWTPQSTPPMTPSPHAHGTPQNTPPRTPRAQALRMPQEAVPTTQGAQRLPTPQSTPPSTPHLQLHPQVLANKTPKMQLPLSPNRQSPRQIYGCEYAYREDGSFFAVKMSSKEDISPEIQQEVDVLSKLDHPNIVRYLGSSIVERRLCIFLELVSMGSLNSLLRKYKRFEDHTIRNYTKQILLGLEYLHRKRTIHRDVKCANILVDVNGQVKLSDFGIAKQVGDSLVSSVKGTPLYMAPEVLTPNEDCYSFPADIWSLGCTVLEMADGKPPWSNLGGFGFLFKVKSGELPPLPQHLSPEGKDFIQRCLNMVPKDRPTASELLQHPFVLNAVTPEHRSPPPSPISPIMWPPTLEMNNKTWACGNCHPLSPNQVTAGYSRAQTIVHGR
ncbi:hypothetical protein GOP47_0020456 [Adiantum capillus-veneris]|uniref:Protein kinase domain-containing protein n=1 Tax=Adiantum capillus-veneris TaxID=13818 RepID=A0A9D4U958_ADICA|nr:hypothetical protein GOP47_0020456 [Adiantum capillus-veneris]